MMPMWGGSPTIRGGSDSSANGSSSCLEPITSPMAATQLKRSNTVSVVPDVSALFALRRVAADKHQLTTVHTATGGGFTAAAGTTAAKAASIKKGSSGVGAAGKFTRAGSSSISEMRNMYGSWDIDCGLATALYARLVLHKWKWAETLMVHDPGKFTFKGITDSHSLVSVCSKVLSARNFPTYLRKSKGTQLTKGQGLLYELKMQPASDRLSPDAAALQQPLCPCQIGSPAQSNAAQLQMKQSNAVVALHSHQGALPVAADSIAHAPGANCCSLQHGAQSHSEEVPVAMRRRPRFKQSLT